MLFFSKIQSVSHAVGFHVGEVNMDCVMLGIGMCVGGSKKQIQKNMPSHEGGNSLKRIAHQFHM